MNSNVLGTSAVVGPLKDLDVYADATFKLSSIDDSLEYLYGVVDVTTGSGHDEIEISFEQNLIYYLIICI